MTSLRHSTTSGPLANDKLLRVKAGDPLGRDSGNDCKRFNIPGDEGVRRHHRTSAYPHAWKYGAIGCQPHIVLDNHRSRWRTLLAVIQIVESVVLNGYVGPD